MNNCRLISIQGYHVFICRTDILDVHGEYHLQLWLLGCLHMHGRKRCVGALTNHKCHFTYCWTHYEHCGRRLTQQQIVFTRTTSRTLLLWKATDFSGFSRQGNHWPQSQRRKFWLLGTLLWTKCRSPLDGDVCWTRNAQGTRFSLMWTSCLCHWNLSHLSLKDILRYIAWSTWCHVILALRKPPVLHNTIKRRAPAGPVRAGFMDALGGASKTWQQKQRVEDMWLACISPTGCKLPSFYRRLSSMEMKVSNEVQILHQQPF